MSISSSYVRIRPLPRRSSEDLEELLDYFLRLSRLTRPSTLVLDSFLVGLYLTGLAFATYFVLVYSLSLDESSSRSQRLSDDLLSP